MNDDADIGQINKEQKKAIDELEEVLDFLKSGQIKDEDILVHIKKPLDCLRSSVKYIPTEPYFEIIPKEIKTKILSYLCDTKAFTAASVCIEWKEILGSRFAGGRVTIGKRCHDFQCTDNMCLINSEMLKASATHKIDVRWVICDPVKEVDSKVVTNGLTSVSRFTLIGECTCDNESDECDVNPLSNDQLEDLFKGLEKKIETMAEVNLEFLDLTELNQDRLVHCFVNKIKRLTLREGRHHGRMFNVETFINKLSQESAEFKLKRLALYLFEYPDELALELANALCNVENVELGWNMPLRLESVSQLFENIVSDTRSVMIKNLTIWTVIDYRTLINPEDLKKLCNEMIALRLDGHFTVEQKNAARSLPDVVVGGLFRTLIKKGL